MFHLVTSKAKAFWFLIFSLYFSFLCRVLYISGSRKLGWLQHIIASTLKWETKTSGYFINDLTKTISGIGHALY